MTIDTLHWQSLMLEQVNDIVEINGKRYRVHQIGKGIATNERGF